MYNGFYIMINYNLHTNRDKQGLGHRVYLAGDLHSKVSVRAGGREEGGGGGRTLRAQRVHTATGFYRAATAYVNWEQIYSEFCKRGDSNSCAM